MFYSRLMVGLSMIEVVNGDTIHELIHVMSVCDCMNLSD
jgi:hypothetical protein